MTPLKLKVSAGASRKLNRQQYGGLPFESSDVWVSFEKELPADADQGLVEAAARHLQKMADQELNAEVKRVISAIQGRVVAPTPEKRSQTAKTAPQTHSKEPGDCQWPGCDKDGKGFKFCFIHSKATREGAVPYKPKEVVPDGPGGTPFS